jgi:hypothetical protein
MKILPNISIGFMDEVSIGQHFGPNPPLVLFFDVGFISPCAQVSFFEVAP